MKRAPLPRRPISASRPLLPSRSRMRLAASRGLTGFFSVMISSARPFLAAHAEQMPRHFADLDLLRAFGDAIAAVVAIDVLERLVAGITDATVHLDCQIRRLAGEPVAAVVRHRHPIADLEVVLAVEVPGGLVDKVAH